MLFWLSETGKIWGFQAFWSCSVDFPHYGDPLAEIGGSKCGGEGGGIFPTLCVECCLVFSVSHIHLLIVIVALYIQNPVRAYVYKNLPLQSQWYCVLQSYVSDWDIGGVLTHWTRWLPFWRRHIPICFRYIPICILIQIFSWDLFLRAWLDFNELMIINLAFLPGCNGLYGLHGSRCPLCSKRPLN